MFDGIQRPLDAFMEAAQSNFLKKGVSVPSLNRIKKWKFNSTVKVGDEVVAGDVIGTVQETAVVLQKIMIPMGISGNIKEIMMVSLQLLKLFVLLKLQMVIEK